MPRLQAPGYARCFLAAYGLAELQEVPRTGRPRHFTPAARGAVTSSATGTPVDALCMAMRWSSDAIATTLSPQTASPILHPSTLWRMLDTATLKPHRPAQPCVVLCLNIKAGLVGNLFPSIQDMMFCPKICLVHIGS
jgi:hypothetical protein